MHTSNEVVEMVMATEIVERVGDVRHKVAFQCGKKLDFRMKGLLVLNFLKIGGQVALGNGKVVFEIDGSVRRESQVVEMQLRGSLDKRLDGLFAVAEGIVSVVITFHSSQKTNQPSIRKTGLSL